MSAHLFVSSNGPDGREAEGLANADWTERLMTSYRRAGGEADGVGVGVRDKKKGRGERSGGGVMEPSSLTLW